MNLTYILAGILALIVLFNIKKIASFIYGITIYPWEMLFSTSTSTGNGAGIFGPLIGLVLVGIQLGVIGTGVIIWLVCR